MKETKEQVLSRMLRDLDELYNNADDSGEENAVSYVEDIVINWYNAVITKRGEE